MTYRVDRDDEQPTATTCSDAPKDCSLRGAILAANANPGLDTIQLPGGVYTLTLAGDETLGEAGDLDITESVTVTGAGARDTVIQACAPEAPATDCVGIDRVFHVHSAGTPVTVSLGFLTIRRGTTKGDGGGILVDAGSTVTLNQCTVEGNAVDGAGGGIAVGAGGVVQLTDSVVARNASGGPGGGIFVGTRDAEPIAVTGVRLLRTTVRDNAAGAGGGGIARLRGTLTIAASTVSGNVGGIDATDATSGSGGGVFLDIADDGPSTISESTVSGNTGHLGGGISATSPLLLSGCTVTANHTEGDSFGAGGIASVGTLTLRNTIVAGNQSDAGKPQDCGGVIVSGGYNLIGDADGCGGVTDGVAGDQAGTSASPIDPGLGPLAANGFSTLTHALLPGSPAINAGNPALPGSGNGACSAFDQRGTPRPQPSGGRCDIGAFELFGSGTTTTTATSTSSTSSTSTTETTTTLESTTTSTSTTATTNTSLEPTSTTGTIETSTSTTSSIASTSTSDTTSTTESTSTTETTSTTHPTTTETTTSTSSTSSSSSSSTSSTTSTTSTTVPPEICGNCIDDDGNGLTDFEDPACCTQLQLSAMNVQKAGLAVAKGHTTLKLSAALVQAGLSAGPKADQDVYLQLRQPGQKDVLCAHLPAANLTRKKRTVQFRDKRHTVATAAGLDSLVLKGKSNGSGVLTVAGSRLSLTLPPAGDVQITVGLRNPTTAETGNRCTTAQIALKAGKKGLKYP